ncbi:MAG: helix-turn-helix domain-containing protein [Candidatus Komeilibacteria bacterium]
MVPCRTQLGSFLRARRLELGLSQVQIAKRLGLGQPEYSGYERGEHTPGNDRLTVYAAAMNWELAQLKELVPRKWYEKKPVTKLGRFLRARREELGLSVHALAKLCGFTIEVVRSWEFGRNRGLRQSSARLLAKALALKPIQLEPFISDNAKTAGSSLGRIIRWRRRELGWSAVDLALKLGKSHQYVSAVELGKTPLCQNDVMIRRLAEVLQLELAVLQAARYKRKLKQIAADPATVSGFIVARRLEQNLSRVELALRAGVTAAIIFYIETGRRFPQGALDKVAQALGCEIPLNLQR